jgi:selenocysteine lyase/cysteine desulfurase
MRSRLRTEDRTVQEPLLPRSDYPALADVTYLNQASLGMMGSPAVTALVNFVEGVGRHGNVFMSDADEVAYFERLRRVGAQILGTNPRQVALVGGASELFGQLPYLLPVDPDQNILLVSSDFPAVTRPWLRLQKSAGCRVTFIDDDPDADLTEALCAAIDSRSAVVAVSYVQYMTGRKVDPDRLRSATEAVGAKLVLDVTQAAGAIPIHADKWRADVVVSSGYKWLGGHGGVALAALAPDLLEAVPALPGWMGATDPFSFDATRLDLAPDARRYTQSTMSYASMAALTVGIQQLLDVGIDAIDDHANALTLQLSEELARSGWKPYSPPGSPCACGHIVSLAADGRDVTAMVQRLRDARIVCGVRGGRIRVSFAAYNNSADVDRLVRALTAV